MSPESGSLRGIVFDLWNTLAFSDVTPNPMVLIAEAAGVAGRADWRRLLERGMMTRRHLGIREGLKGVEAVSGHPIAAASREILIRRWNEASAATRLYDDSLPALRALRGRFRLGLLSNTQSFDLDFLQSRGLSPLFDALCLSCDEGRLKPDPIFFQAVARRLGLLPREIAMVGDSVEDDVRGALGAGFVAVHLDRGGGAPAVEGALVVRILTELPALLAGGDVRGA
ncbi:MAG: HAD family hydrolase [Acidobacteria bacterium]|nr:HAD family hydrolase [Acidobacteriota bacterium]